MARAKIAIQYYIKYKLFFISQCVVAAVLRCAAELDFTGVLEDFYIAFHTLDAPPYVCGEFVRTFARITGNCQQQQIYSLIYSLIFLGNCSLIP